MAFNDFVSLLFAFTITYAHQSAIVDVKSKPIIFGETVVIRCLVPNEQCRYGTTEYRQWTGGEHFELLCLNGTCLKPEKYSMVSTNATYGFELFIHNFSVNDINCEYSFYCGSKVFTTNLSIEANEAYKLPSKNTTIDASIITGEGLSVNLTLQEVRPIPNCYIYFTDEMIAGPIPFEVTSTGIFSTASWRELISIKHTECSGKMEVICNVLSRKIKIIDKYLEYCKGHVSNQIIKFVSTIAGSFLLVLLIVLIYRVTKQKHCHCCFATKYKFRCNATLEENKKLEQQVIKTLLNKSDF